MQQNITPQYNDNFIRYVGYLPIDEAKAYLFSEENINKISKKITELTIGVLPNNRPIIVPNTTIGSVMSNIFDTDNIPTGDIYGRANIPGGRPADLNQYIEDQTIEAIVSDIVINLGMMAQNAKLTKWTTVLGDFNNNGLRGHSVIKIKNRRPNPMEFHMHY